MSLSERRLKRSQVPVYTEDQIWDVSFWGKWRLIISENEGFGKKLLI